MFRDSHGLEITPGGKGKGKGKNKEEEEKEEGGCSASGAPVITLAFRKYISFSIRKGKGNYSINVGSHWTN